jgi:hypothetical protein
MRKYFDIQYSYAVPRAFSGQMKIELRIFYLKTLIEYENILCWS